MARRSWICVAALVLLGADRMPAYACSCTRVSNFQQRVEAAPIVVVGQITSVGENPPLQTEAAPNVAIVRPPFMGTGLTLAIASVAKGELAGIQIRIWDVSYGSCDSGLRSLTIGTPLIAAIWPVSDTPATERATWGAASFIPESDYFTAGACGSGVQALRSDEIAAWIGRKIPSTRAGAVLDDRLPSARIPLLP